MDFVPKLMNSLLKLIDVQVLLVLISDWRCGQVRFSMCKMKILQQKIKKSFQQNIMILPLKMNDVADFRLENDSILLNNDDLYMHYYKQISSEMHFTYVVHLLCIYTYALYIYA